MRCRSCRGGGRWSCLEGMGVSCELAVENPSEGKGRDYVVG